MDSFDPYYSWLGIRDPRRPPTHYRLLGLDPFEDDQEVIGHAADRQMGHVRTYQGGRDAAITQQILNELAGARLTLADPARKAAYDAALRQELGMPRLASAPRYTESATVPQPQMWQAPPVPQAPLAPALPLTSTLPSSLPQFPGMSYPGMSHAIGQYPAMSPTPPGTAAYPSYPQSYLTPQAAPTYPAYPGQPPGMPYPGMANGPVDPASRAGVGAGAARLAAPTSENGPGGAYYAPQPGLQPAHPDQTPTRQAEQAPATENGNGNGKRKPSRERTTSAADEEPDYQFKVKIPPAVLVIAAGVLLMAVFAGFKMVQEARTQQAAEAALAKKNALPPVAVAAVEPEEPKITTKKGAAAPDLPPVVEAIPATAQVRVLRGHLSAVTGVSVSPDGLWAASSGDDKTVRWWDLKTGEAAGSIDRHTGPVTSVSISADGFEALSGSLDKSVRYWDRVQSSQVQRLLGHTQAVNCVLILPDGKSALSGGVDATMKMWDLKRGELLRTFEGHTRPVQCLAVSPDARRIASGSSDGNIKIWDLEGGNEIATFEVEQRGVLSLAFSPDSRELLYGGTDGNVRRLDVASGEELTDYFGHANKVRGVSFLLDSRIVSASEDGTLRIWSTADGEELLRYELPGTTFRSMAVGTDGLTVLTGAADSSVRVWRIPELPLLPPPSDPSPSETDTDAGQLRNLAAHTSEVRDVAFSPDGTHLASAGSDGVLRIFNAESGADVQKITIGPLPLNTVAFSPDGSLVLAGGGDGKVAVLDVKTGESLRAFTGHNQSAVTVARFVKTAEGPLSVLSADQDRSVLRWDPQMATPLGKLESTGYGNRWAFSANGTLAISAGYDRTIRLWDLAQGKELGRLPIGDGQSWTACLAVSANGQRLVSGGLDRALHVWDLETRRELFRCAGHEGKISAVAISADGRRAISGGYDLALRLWDVRSGREIFRFPGQRAPASCVAFSADGEFALTGDREGSVRHWRLPKLPPRSLPPDIDPAALVVETKSKLPIPDEASRAEAEKIVADKLVAQDVAKMDATAKATMAGQLFVEALAADDKPGLRYALLIESRNLAAQAGDFPNAMESVDMLAGEFAVNALTLKAEALLQPVKGTRSTEAQLAQAASAASLADRAMANDDYEMASQLWTLVGTLARKVGGAPMVNFVATQTQRVRSLATEFDKIRPLQSRLTDEPADAEANLALGKFYAYQQGDWPRALPMLALGGDPELRKLAIAMLFEPTSPQAQLDVAQSFAALTRAASDPVTKVQLQRRAYDWARMAALSQRDDAVKQQAQQLAQELVAALIPKVDYLTALPPESVSVGRGMLGTGGRLGYEAAGLGLVVVRGVVPPEAISIHPADTGSARVTYRLFKQFGTFRCTVAVNDTAAAVPLASRLVFKVVGDGKELFASDRLEKAAESQAFVIDLTGVDKLDLIVDCDGPSDGAHAVWLEPRIHRAVK